MYDNSASSILAGSLIKSSAIYTVSSLNLVVSSSASVIRAGLVSMSIRSLRVRVRTPNVRTISPLSGFPIGFGMGPAHDQIPEPTPTHKIHTGPP